jgi:uncharacterized cupredoxin-like copper-binding protein
VSRVLRIALALGIAGATTSVGYALSGSARAASPTELGPGLVTVNVHVRYSKFSISTLHVRAGTTVRFLVHNDDPINHEFVVGDARVHALHARGTEKTHPPVPGEVSVPPGDVGETFLAFPNPGRFLFACHLPGHFAYGMHGWVVVDPVTSV